MNKIQHLSRFHGNRKISIFTKKKAVQYWLLELKDERQIAQEYGISLILLWRLRKWYWYHYERPIYIKQKTKPKTVLNMRSEKKLLEAKIKEQEKRIKMLEEQLEWAEMKSIAFETMIQVAEKQIGKPLRKKPVAKQSGKSERKDQP